MGSGRNDRPWWRHDYLVRPCRAVGQPVEVVKPRVIGERLQELLPLARFDSNLCHAAVWAFGIEAVDATFNAGNCVGLGKAVMVAVRPVAAEADYVFVLLQLGRARDSESHR